MLHLPLLNALKTFVVAGQHLNFTKAADELLVSPSAVSHQIRVLEDYLGIKLFVRQSRSLSLTTEGQSLHKSLQGPFDQIARAIQDALQQRGRDSLHISLRPFFSSAWLASRLGGYWLQYPQSKIDLIHTIKVPDFAVDDIDLGIVWGQGDWPDMHIDFLIPGDLTPICSAELIAEKGRPETPADLARFTLIHDEDHSAWDSWMEKAGVGGMTVGNSLIIDDTNVRLQSIQNHQGVMLGCPTLLRAELEAGNLVQLFDICLDTYAYYLVYPEHHVPGAAMQKFIDWILAETKAKHSSQ